MTMLHTRFSLCFNLLGALLLVLALSSDHALGQATTGSISAHVSDPKGNAIQGAAISIQDLDKGLITTAVTDGAGDFVVSAMPPDHYKIVVEKSGFDTATGAPFLLDIDQKANFTIRLKIGEVSTTVTVTDSTPVLQTQGAETGQVISTQLIQDLPVQGRNFASLLLLVPGVNTGGGGNNLNISVDGQREFSNSVQVNGVEVTGNRNNDTNLIPSLDAMQEFKVVESAYAPEFGRASGGALVVQTRSGGNQIHGSAFFFDRPTATAANPALSPAGSTPTLNQKIYGATFGGPAIKDKFFYFFAYEGNRASSSSSYLGETPPLGQIVFRPNGDVDLSGLRDPYDNTEIPIFDPAVTAANYGGYTTQFPGNVIPNARISTAGRKILQNLFPQPLTNNYAAYFTNFVINQNSTDNNNVGNLRMDYTFSQNNRIYLTYDAEQGDTSESGPYDGHTPTFGGGGDNSDLTSFENHAIGFTYDHTFSPTLLNEARVTYLLSTVNQNSPIYGSYGANLTSQYGIQNAVIPGFSQTNSFPQIELADDPSIGGSTYKPLSFRDKNPGLMDAVTWARGHHNAKFGYEYRKLNSHPDFSLFPVPYEYFGGVYSALTSDPTYSYYDGNAAYGNGGNEVADLLLGLPLDVDQGLQLTKASTSANEHSFYLQDYWQITQKLNITYGMRYEYQQPYVEANNNESNFDITTLRVQLAGRGSNSRSLVNSNTTDFMPRIGIAYQLTPKTVLRGGFGIFYSPENDAREDILTKNYPFFVQESFYNSPYNGSYSFTLDAGVARPTTIAIPSGASYIDMSTGVAPTQTLYSEPNNFPTANSKNFNVAVQRDLGMDTSLEVSYVGAVTRNLSYEVGNYNVKNHLSSKIDKVQTLLPVGIANYNSMQVKLTRQMRHGYQALISYTYAHSLDNGPAPFDLGNGGTGPQNPFNVNSEYANSNNDHRHNLVATQLIELPFGRGRRWVGHAGPVVNAFVGGWQLNSITQLETGSPFNVVSNGNDPNFPGLRPNIIGNPNVGHRSTTAWFNRSAFKVPTGQSAGDISGNAPRNFLFGPGFTNENLSLFKVFDLPHGLKFQTRFEAFNLLNTAHWNAPDSNLGDGTRAGTITGGYDPRVMQFAGRLTF
jgi:hypothetical protein